MRSFKKVLVVLFRGTPIVVLLVAGQGCNKLFTSATSEDFDHFYDQFHEDDDFQLQRVRFPLEGGWQEPESEGAWTRENWILHQEKVTNITEPGYTVEINRSENVVTERVILEGTGYNSERRFEKIDNKWYLVYYETTNL